jgi:hypothetical protein
VLLAMPKTLESSCQRLLANWGPLSEVMSSGMPNREIQPRIIAREHVTAVASDSGMALGQRVNRSMMVNKYV